ncbi:MFS transporter [Rathayibacter sp. VKM Ac-2803]|uniref:MFS transporter n=1 Tax=unclassified Rathayibacter TaxID=2609250 RepID=UPI001356F552|nr:MULTISPECIES: MFS transporter [unclassified Rathayibacter]MWV48280.1 MFS transporter [Rathayibacter sp. VKM Ac-2803]MWV59227.1 MFS transporter [Rathayibacter sp. VKM Ac-2754]
MAALRSPWAVLVVTTLGSMLMFVNATSINVALPAISGDLGVTAATADWFLLAYMLALSMTVLVFSRLSDMVGRRRLYLAGLVLMIAASLIASVVVDPITLIVLRALQGVAAASIIPNANAIISDTFPPTMLTLGLSINIMAASAASIVGPVLGGVLLESMGWRSLFLVNVPFGVLALILGMLILPKDHRSRSAGDRFDVVGAVLVAAALAALLLGVNRVSVWGLDDPRVLTLFALALVLGMIFAVVERRTTVALIDTSILIERARALALTSAFLMAFPQSAVLVLVVLHQQLVLGVSSVQAGLIAAVTAAALVVTSPMAGVLARRFSSRTVSSTGCALSAVGYGLTAASFGQASSGLLIAGLLLVGAGNGVFTAPNTAAIMTGLPVSRRGIANGVRSLLFNGAQTTGTAVALVLVTAGLAAVGIDGYDTVVSNRAAVASAFVAAGLLLAAFGIAATVASISRGGSWLALARPVGPPTTAVQRETTPTPALRGEGL